MSGYVAKGEKDYDATGAPITAKIHKIRITLTSSNVRNLEKCELLLARFNKSPDLTDSTLHSLSGFDQPRQRQGIARQGPRSFAYQGPQDHDPQDGEYPRITYTSFYLFIDVLAFIALR